MDLKNTISHLQKLISILKAIHSTKQMLNDYQLEEKLEKALIEIKEANLIILESFLETEEKKVTDRIRLAIENRRESLLSAARSLNISCKRFTDYDRVGPLKVVYKNKKVKLEIGNEIVTEFVEADGAKIIEKAKQALETLEAEPFERERFFQTLKDTLQLARNHGRVDREGWVSVRTVYAYAVLIRHLHLEEFTKKPENNRFRKYSRAQFVYDLARFGVKGWAVKDEMLRSRTPNMATVAAGNAMIIPDLRSVEGMGMQVAVLKIERVGG